MPSAKDSLYAHNHTDVTAFRFDEKVVKVFPDMIQRSVPGYATILQITGQLAERYAQNGSHCYDLGCSLGASLLAMRKATSGKQLKLIGVDNSVDMLERCRNLLADDDAENTIELIVADILDQEITNASLCALNFTLQFVDKSRRTELLSKIYRGMRPGGVLILSEKIDFEDREHAELMTELHHNFKRMNGYSDLEIAQKRDAIENVLIPESFQQHQYRLQECGFRGIELWFQCFNFASIVAFK
ncbi:MAG: tRNA (cmo5U34)-methyltransferase [Flavobacteriales bacterium]|jgi:tRNA (cmo5U34)-methyltransferase